MEINRDLHDAKWPLYLTLAIVTGILLLISHEEYFVTNDGVAHLYNTRIFTELLNKNSFLSQAYYLNPTVVPNYLTTLILSTLCNLFSPASSEKILLAIIFYTIVFSIWGIIRSDKESNSWVILFVPILLLNYLLALGMYNFMLGIGFMFSSIYVYIHCNGRYTRWWTLVFAISLFLLYLSHALVYLITLFILFSFEFVSQIKYYYYNRKFRKYWHQNFIILILIAGPGIVLFAIYSSSRNYVQNNSYLDFETVFSFLTEFRVLFAYVPAERICSKLMFIPVFSTFAIQCYCCLVNYKNWSVKDVCNRGKWFLIFLVLLFGIFFLPDEASGGGYIILRLQLLFLFFGLIWMSFSGLSKRIIFANLLIIYLPFVYSVHSKLQVQKDLNKIITTFIELDRILPENSVIYTVRHSDLWMDYHFSNYLGISKPRIILDNYEVSTGYFPICGRGESEICIQLPFEQKSDLEYSNFKVCKKMKGLRLDYVFEYGRIPMTITQSALIDSVRMHSELIFDRESLKVYKLRYAN